MQRRSFLSENYNEIFTRSISFLTNLIEVGNRQMSSCISHVISSCITSFYTPGWWIEPPPLPPFRPPPPTTPPPALFLYYYNICFILELTIKKSKQQSHNHLLKIKVKSLEFYCIQEDQRILTGTLNGILLGCFLLIWGTAEENYRTEYLRNRKWPRNHVCIQFDANTYKWEFGRIRKFYVNIDNDLHISSFKFSETFSSVCVRLCKHKAPIFYSI